MDRPREGTTPNRRLPLHTKILIGLIIGAAGGGSLKAVLGEDSGALTWTVDHITDPIGQLFLRLLLMIVVPLVFSALVIGVAGIGDVRKLGRVGLKSFAYTLVLSAISVGIGLTLANTVRPGTRIDAATRDELMERYSTDAQKVADAATQPGSTDTPLMSVVKTLVPSNPIASVARPTPDMLGLMFFALFFGVALTLINKASAAPVVSFLTSVYEAVAKLIETV